MKSQLSEHGKHSFYNINFLCKNMDHKYSLISHLFFYDKLKKSIYKEIFNLIL